MATIRMAPFLAAPRRSRLGLAAGWCGGRLRLVAQLGVLWLFFAAGTALVEALAVPLPANLVGMLLLLGALSTGLVRPAMVQGAGDLVVRHLAFFFVALAVGVMTRGGLFAAHGLVLLVSLLASALVGVAAAGLVAQRLGRRGVDGDGR